MRTMPVCLGEESVESVSAQRHQGYHRGYMALMGATGQSRRAATCLLVAVLVGIVVVAAYSRAHLGPLLPLDRVQTGALSAKFSIFNGFPGIFTGGAAKAPDGVCAAAYDATSSTNQNCLDSGCCVDAGLTCYAKHPRFGACRPSCHGDVDLAQPVELQTPWSCEKVSPKITYSPASSTSSSPFLVKPQPQDPPGFIDDTYVELKADPMAGGFLKKDEAGHWDVWPRMGGRSFQGFLGYGYNRVKAEGGKVADNINPEEWILVAFPLAPTGPAPSGYSFTTTDWHHYPHGNFKSMVGKTLRFTIDGLGGNDCGCNANFYAVRDADCDGSGNMAGNCEEIDFFEGNKYSWHSTLHTLADSGKTDSDGLTTGYGGTLPTHPNFPSFDGTEYGPGGTMIDTEKSFSVAASFPKGPDGKLKGMCVELSQEGKPSMKQPLFMHLYEYKGSFHSQPATGGFVVENGMAKVEKRMNEGVIVLSSLWHGGMSWLDGAASTHGPENIMDGKCTWDSSTCAPFTLHNIQVQDLLDSQRPTGNLVSKK